MKASYLPAMSPGVDGEAPPLGPQPAVDQRGHPPDAASTEAVEELSVDADGIVRRGASLALVPPIEARLLTCLLGSPSKVVHRADLLAAGWSSPPKDPHILDSRIRLLRRRLAPLEVAIRTVRGIGFILDDGTQTWWPG